MRGVGCRVQGAGSPLTLLSRRAPLRSTSSCGPASAAGTSCSAHSASASPEHSILRESSGNAPGTVRDGSGELLRAAERRAERRDLGGTGPVYEALGRGDEPSLRARPTSRFPSLPRGRSHFPFPVCFFFFSLPSPVSLPSAGLDSQGCWDGKRRFPKLPERGAGAASTSLGRTHITRSGRGSTTVSPPPPAPPPRAAAVRGSAPSGQYPGPPGSPRARHRAGGS